jgi:uncharacterized protein YacL (UPF0231 family)
MFYVFETVEGRVFVCAESKVEAVKAELLRLGEEYDLYMADDIQIRGNDLDVKYYSIKKEMS